MTLKCDRKRKGNTHTHTHTDVLLPSNALGKRMGSSTSYWQLEGKGGFFNFGSATSLGEGKL